MIARFILQRDKEPSVWARFILLRDVTPALAQAWAAEAVGAGRRRLEGGVGGGGERSGRGAGLPRAALRSLVRRVVVAEERASSGEME